MLLRNGNKKIGLVLGSGGARGLAHVGAVKALIEYGVRPSVIVGTSFGAIVGAAIASGRFGVLDFTARNVDLARAVGVFFEFGVHRDGLIKGKRVMDFLGQILPDCSIEELPIPFAVLATDIETGEPVVIDKGKVLQAVRASISIPGVFTPVRRGKRILVDGGISSPVPVSTAMAKGADFVVAINVDNSLKCPYQTRRLPGVISKALDFTAKIKSELSDKIAHKGASLDGLLSGYESGYGFFDILMKTTRICEDRIAREELLSYPADLLIEPAVGDIPTLDFARSDDAIQAGYDAAVEALEKLY